MKKVKENKRLRMKKETSEQRKYILFHLFKFFSCEYTHKNMFN